MIAGVDGYKGGWIATIQGNDDKAHVEYFPTFSDLAKKTDLNLIVIDIPIGLPQPGSPRRADIEVRKLLRQRGCCVFPAPIRPLLKCHTQAQATTEGRQLEGKGCPIMLWCIIPKIKEVDSLMRTQAGLKARVKEGHPEVTFAVMNGDQPIPVSKHKREGQQIRLELLREWFGDRPRDDCHAKPGAREDIIDAYAMLWTARRFVNDSGRVRRFPDGEAPIDSEGLPMQIIA